MTSAVLGSVVLVLIAFSFAILFSYRFNPLNRTKVYRVHRILNLSLAGLLYFSFYMSRYSLAVSNTEATRKSLGASEAEFGRLLMVGFWSYGTFQILNGVLCDQLGGTIGMICGGICCAVFTATSGLLFFLNKQTFTAILLLNAANMGANTFGSLGFVTLNSKWFDRKERGSFSGTFGVLIACGYWAALVGGGLIFRELHIYSVFLIPSMMLLVFATLSWFFVSDQPYRTSLGEDVIREVQQRSPEGFRVACQNLKAVILNRQMQVVSVCLFGLGWTREGFLSWFAAFLETSHDIHVGSPMFTTVATVISISGMLGSVFGGWLSDHIFNSDRTRVCLLYITCSAFVLIALSLIQNTVIVIVLLGCLSVFVLGVLSLLMGSVAVEVVETRLTGTASGIANAFQYLGSGMGSAVIGSVIQNFGWGSWPYSMLPGTAFSFISMCLLILMRSRRRAVALPDPPLTEIVEQPAESQPSRVSN
eukprot:c11385_g1_i1.p1 GENE.c11385_g1_i1~~c11385_g1_i1.p1  ORF type:complete len:477 (+),score=78.46 c11385_g1_i1:54-1484(+)